MNIVERTYAKHNVPALVKEHDAKFDELKRTMASGLFGESDLSKLTDEQTSRLYRAAIRQVQRLG